MLTAAMVRSLPVPADSQWNAFAAHLAAAHSWYKHLPLFGGGEFVVFLAPDAGQNYPLEHPKLPTENTREGYLRAFGHLDYIYRESPSYPFSRDALRTPRLDDELLAIGRFNLYPFVSDEFYWSVHEDDVARIRNGAVHPYAAAILDAYDAEQQMDQCWAELSKIDRDVIIEIHDEDAAMRERSRQEPVLRYLQLEEAASAAYAALREPEALKIRSHLEALRRWLAKSKPPMPPDQN